MEYSDFSVVSGLINQCMHPFQNFHPVFPDPSPFTEGLNEV